MFSMCSEHYNFEKRKNNNQLFLPKTVFQCSNVAENLFLQAIRVGVGRHFDLSQSNTSDSNDWIASSDCQQVLQKPVNIHWFKKAVLTQRKNLQNTELLPPHPFPTKTLLKQMKI